MSNDGVEEIDPQNLWEMLLGEDDGMKVRIALTALWEVDPTIFSKAINEISMNESVMPLLDPSSWLDGTRSDNSRHYKDVLHKLKELTEVLNEKRGNRSIPNSPVTG